MSGGKIRSRVKCLKFDKSHGYLVITNVPISNDVEIIQLTIGSFVMEVLNKLNQYLEYHQEYFDKLTPYETMGFLEPAKPSDYLDEKVKAVLEKRNMLLQAIPALAHKAQMGFTSN